MSENFESKFGNFYWPIQCLGLILKNIKPFLGNGSYMNFMKKAKCIFKFLEQQEPGRGKSDFYFIGLFYWVLHTFHSLLLQSFREVILVPWL